jgi:hypothetical protein
MKTAKLISLVSVLVACAVTSVQAEVTVKKAFKMPSVVQGTVTTTDCENSPGPFITLDGELLLGGLQVKVILQNNVKGTHTATGTFTTNAQLLALGEAIVLPKQPVQGGVGGNPHIWLQLHNGSGQNLTDEIYLGRCVQGLEISPAILSSVIAAADVEVFDCSNAPGPNITIGGTLTLSGLHARFIFRNNLKGTHTAEAKRDLVLVANGSTLTMPKHPVVGGAGGNPIISIQFLQGDGTPIGTPIKLGRCVQL